MTKFRYTNDIAEKIRAKHRRAKNRRAKNRREKNRRAKTINRRVKNKREKHRRLENRRKKNSEVDVMLVRHFFRGRHSIWGCWRVIFRGNAVFGEVAVSLFVAGAAFGKIWNDSGGPKREK